jgi:hypothetical protein
MRPPSKAALTFFPETAGSEGKTGAISVMAAGQLLSGEKKRVYDHFFTLNQGIMPPLPPKNYTPAE